MLQAGRKIAFYTLGCKLNQFETEVMADSFAKKGASVNNINEVSDIYIINTCTVTSKSDQKARRIIRKISRDYPESVVIVTGCYAQLDPEALENLGENIVVVTQERKNLIIEHADKILEIADAADNAEKCRAVFKSFFDAAEKAVQENKSGSEGDFSSIQTGYVFHARAFLKIQDGCDNFCRYCRVPLARGASKSADFETVLQSIDEIEKSGYREVVLTGVNISSYLNRGKNLVDLVLEILSRTRNLRIRLSSLEPDSITEKYSEIISHERICPHFHLPVQSGSDSILSSMGRKYSSAKIYEAVKILRASGKDLMISADFITGFPGESDEDFKQTENLIKDISFASLHVFPFSKRRGTRAYSMKNIVPDPVIRERAEKLRIVSGELLNTYSSRWYGREVYAVLESSGSGESGHIWNGLTENYLKVNIDMAGVEGIESGAMVKCMLKKDGETGGNNMSADFISFCIDNSC